MRVLSGIFILFLVGSMACPAATTERTVSFGDYRIRLNDSGEGQPAVIVEAALGSGYDAYDTLQTGISKLTRVLSYDRPGMGSSERSPKPRTLPVYVEELRALLEAEDIRPPYILVGHSMGGLIMRYFTDKYPGEVAGLVLIDCTPEGWIDYFRSNHTDEEIASFHRVIDPDQYDGVTGEEWEQLENNLALIRGVRISPGIPTRAITSILFTDFHREMGYHPEDMKVWARMQAEVMDGVLDARQVVTEKSPHSIQQTEPELIIDSVRELIEIYRNAAHEDGSFIPAIEIWRLFL